MNLKGAITRLRAVEPRDIDLMYAWENDTDIWSVSGTVSPFSRHTLELFIKEQRFDIFQTRQLRLMIEPLDTERPAPTDHIRIKKSDENSTNSAIGAIDIFEFDPLHGRAGLGILIHDNSHRGKGYASDALETMCAYARNTLHIHQLWCNVGVDNKASTALFQSAGFMEVGIKREWSRTEEGYADERLMQKIL